MASYTEDTREQALTQLMHLYGDSIKRMCGVYLRDMGMADDAAQETFIKAYDHIDEWLDGEINNEKAWLMRIAINTCKDTLRSSWMRHIDRRQEIEALPLSIASCPEEKLALTEHEAESALQTIIEEKTGLSYTPEWDAVIKGIVDNSHTL